MIDFVQTSKRGVMLKRRRSMGEAMAD
jgi:hypothetical protein